MEKKLITSEIREKLKAEFPDEAYKKHPTKTFLTTLTAMYIVERLNDVFGIGRWCINHEVVIQSDNYVLMKGQLILKDYDSDITEQYGGHTIVGKNTEMADGYKSAITDILSKTASYLEIGIEMFKGNINVSNTQESTTNKSWLNPNTPEWNNCIKVLKDGSYTIKSIEKKYKISQTNRELLLTESM